MLKNMPTLEVVLIIVVITAWTGVLVPQALAQRARVPQTGQTTSYAPEDDGDIQAGVEWPTPRFTNRGNGKVRDNLTGLIWLRNANCSAISQADWLTALTYVNGLAHGQCGLTDDTSVGTWRLPNVRELLSLIDFGQSGYSGAFPANHPFLNVQIGNAALLVYWSSTT
jgi:hypothetical protein